VQYEISSSKEGGEGAQAISLAKRLIPLTKGEIFILIKDRRRRLSFLEDHEKICFPGHPVP